MKEYKLLVLERVTRWINGTLPADIRVEYVPIKEHDAYGDYSVIVPNKRFTSLPTIIPSDIMIDIEKIRVEQFRMGFDDVRLPSIYAGYGEESRTLLIGKLCME